MLASQMFAAYGVVTPMPAQVTWIERTCDPAGDCVVRVE